MASRMKEDEKNEKIIRGLRKLPENKRCINCNSLGPQYVCTNFWTFVCLNCSGIHREFTHRVKSVSMSKFTLDEVRALQAGGNERAREIYFKELDPQRHFLPDGSNVERLRDFIRHVYMDRRYTGESSAKRALRTKGERDNTIENRKVDTYRDGPRSPAHEDIYESRHHDRSSPVGRINDRSFSYSSNERKSPRCDLESRRYGSYRRSPARFEVVDDRVRDERFKNRNQNRRPEENRPTEQASKTEGRSTNHQTGINTLSPPAVHPVRDIMGEDVPPLQNCGSPKENGSTATGASAQQKKAASSSSLASIDENSAEMKRVNSGSLIDFNVDPERLAAVATTDLFTGQDKATQAPSNSSALESTLFQLSAPETAPAGNMSTLPAAGFEPLQIEGGQSSTMQKEQQLSLLSAVDSQSTVQQSMPSICGAANNQQWDLMLAQNVQGPVTALPGQPSQAAPSPPQQTDSAIPSQPLPAEAKISGRKELPEDLFTMMYSPAPVPVLGWQAAPPHGMGYGMQYPQYPTAMSVPSFTQSSISTNPFDLGSEPTQVLTPMFPSMGALQLASPNMPSPSLLSRSSSFSTASPSWVPPQQPSYPSAMPPSAYLIQQALNNMSPTSHQGIGGFGSAGAVFGELGADQQSATRYSHPTIPSSFSSPGGNPFG